jgi:hypothetical protein
MVAVGGIGGDDIAAATKPARQVVEVGGVAALHLP